MRVFPGAILCGLLAYTTLLQGAETAAEIAQQLKAAQLDPQECYRVREVHLTREDLKFYFTDGWLIFGKPVAGRVVSAVFVVDETLGDAEVLVMPPTVGERMSLASFTKSPNLDEHFISTLMLFTDDTAEALKSAIERRGDVSRSMERGLLLADAWKGTVGNLMTSFATRLVQHLIGGLPPERGFFYAAIQGRQLGNFDALWDPDAAQSIYLGQLKSAGDRTFYDTWTSFPARGDRSRGRTDPDSEFSLSNYRIEAVFDDALSMTAVTQATITPKRDGLRALAFDISARMKIGAVRINGNEVEVFTRESLRSDLIRGGGSTLFLAISPTPLEAGRHYELVVEHGGSVVHEVSPGVYSPGGRGNWYPRYGLEFAQFDITFTYPARLQMVFPGDVKDERTEENQRTTRRVTRTPIRLAGFNLGEYVSAKVERGELAVEVYANRRVEASLAPRAEVIILRPGPISFPNRRGAPTQRQPEVLTLPAPRPPDPTERLVPLAEEIASAFEFLASHLGPPALPTLMVSPIPGGFGQGFPGVVYLSTVSYLEERDRPASLRDVQQDLFFSEILQAHETAHQWWGNVVFPATGQDDWLMEALANYSALLYVEKSKGPKAVDSVLERYRQHLMAKNEAGKEIESAGPIRLGPRLSSSQSPGAWTSIVYQKGTWIMHMLRRRLGSENFLKFLGELCRRYRHQPVGAAEFQQLAASYLPKGSADPKLDSFFEHWVEGVGIPTVTMTSAVKGAAPKVVLTVTVKHSGIDDKAALSVPVEVQVRGRSQTHWIEAGADPVTLTLTLPAAPSKVVLDPDRALLRR